MSLKISEMTAASVVDAADLIPIVQGGTNKAAAAYLVGGPPSRGVLWGLRTSKSAALTVGVAAGIAWDVGGTGYIQLSASITKLLSATWAVGSGNGGLDTGAVSGSKAYYVFLIRRPDTGVVDVLLSLSSSAPTMPTNYTQKCRIGAVISHAAGTSIYAYQQRGQHFTFDAILGAFDGAIGTGGTSIDLTYLPSVPINARFIARCQLAGNLRSVIFRSSLVSNQAPGGTAYNSSPAPQLNVTAANLGTSSAEISRLTEDRTVWAQSAGGNITTFIELLGWEDLGLRPDV